ncbi:hypothetical protein BD410DRAFT_624722 [Rickenella mellea]|uniref:Uncharacterized protein n=1 Tax=Rickenella mellea TaxID=50990 RepID=A0A4Y7PMI0_9AGAM|nr:hypothetical protein BD410DRAFT_624722 [Rickenella mellea]
MRFPSPPFCSFVFIDIRRRIQTVTIRPRQALSIPLGCNVRAWQFVLLQKMVKHKCSYDSSDRQKLRPQGALRLRYQLLPIFRSLLLLAAGIADRTIQHSHVQSIGYSATYNPFFVFHAIRIPCNSTQSKSIVFGSIQNLLREASNAYVPSAVMCNMLHWRDLRPLPREALLPFCRISDPCNNA